MRRVVSAVAIVIALFFGLLWLRSTKHNADGTTTYEWFIAHEAVSVGEARA